MAKEIPPRLLLGIGALVFFVVVLIPILFVRKFVVRGLRNKNPTNLKLTNIDWFGKVPNEDNTDGDFEQFFFDGNGLRAGMRNYWKDYHGSKNLQTLRTIISDNTPASENDTAGYVQRTADHLGLDPDEVFEWDLVKYELAKRIIIEENGFNPFPDSFIIEHVDRAEVYIA